VSSQRPKIAITMGDPAGVGPEICLLALTNPDISAVCIPIVFGDAAILERAAHEIGLEPPENVIPLGSWSEAQAGVDKPSVLDIGAMNAEELTPGQVTAQTGHASYEYIMKAIEAAQAGYIDGVTTAPINKEAFREGGVNFPGHTELFAERTKAKRACMMMTSPDITCSLVTVHVGYTEVPALLTQDRILDVIDLTQEAMMRLRGRTPQLTVCGLNPHAGEHGLFGHKEEEEIILPAVNLAKDKGYDIVGPISPDTAFLPAVREVTDAYICMYHDQGLIPLKALAFDDAINVTLGLDMVRTSVDHGTALDIAWQGKVSPNSMFEAILLAVKLTKKSVYGYDHDHFYDEHHDEYHDDHYHDDEHH